MYHFKPTEICIVPMTQEEVAVEGTDEWYAQHWPELRAHAREYIGARNPQFFSDVSAAWITKNREDKARAESRMRVKPATRCR